jgi:hypothetical protein
LTRALCAIQPALPQQIFPTSLEIVQPIGEVVKKLRRIGPVAQTVAIRDAALLLGHKLTGSRDLGVKRVQLEHTHDINPFGRIAQFRGC